MELNSDEMIRLDKTIKGHVQHKPFMGGIAGFMNFLTEKYKGEIPTTAIMRIGAGDGLAVNMDELIEFYNQLKTNDNGTAN